MAPPWVTALAAVTVVVMALGALAYGVGTDDWTPLTLVMPAVMLFLGFAFGIKIIRRQVNGNGHH